VTLDIDASYVETHGAEGSRQGARGTYAGKVCWHPPDRDHPRPRGLAQNLGNYSPQCQASHLLMKPNRRELAASQP